MVCGGEKKSGDSLVVLRFQSPGVSRRRRIAVFVPFFFLFFSFFLNHMIIV